MRCGDGEGGRKAAGLRQRDEDKFEMKSRKLRGRLHGGGFFLKPHVLETALEKKAVFEKKIPIYV